MQDRIMAPAMATGGRPLNRASRPGAPEVPHAKIAEGSDEMVVIPEGVEMPEIPNMAELQDLAELKDLKIELPDMAILKDLEIPMMNMQDGKSWANGGSQKEVEAAMKEARKAIEMARKELQRALKETESLRKIQPQVEKSLKQALKQLESQKGMNFKTFSIPEGDLANPGSKDTAKLWMRIPEGSVKTYTVQPKGTTKGMTIFPKAKSNNWTFKTETITTNQAQILKVMNSLTEEQKAKMTNRGYLVPMDLTPNIKNK
jgi:hypothetical protein